MNYWKCQMHSDGPDGKPRLNAIYVVATTPATLQEDLAVEHSNLRQHFAAFRPGIDAEAFVAEHPIDAQGILAAIIAQATYLLRSSLWGMSHMGVTNPRTGIEQIPEPDSLGEPIWKENGVLVWLEEEPPPQADSFD